MLFVLDISLWQWLADLVIVVALLNAECRATIQLLSDLVCPAWAKTCYLKGDNRRE